MTKPIKSNLDKEQRKAFYEIKKDDNIMIYPFDKGSGLVRINSDSALIKIQEHLGEYKDLYPSDAISSRLYGVIKAHKPEKNYPTRVIVSTIGAATYKISKFLADMIQFILNKNNTHLKNSQQFVNLANSWNIDKDKIQVSYDIINLYLSVPANEAIIILIEKLKNDPSFTSKFNFDEIKTLLDICLLHCYFLFENDIYELEDSGPIGLGLMVVAAECFLQFHESNAIAQAYTMEIENENNTLNFLDVTIINNKTGTYDFKVYRKDALTNVQIKPSSCHDPKIINGIFKGFVHRALYLCSDNIIEQELLFLVDVFVENGYKKTNLEHIIKTTKENLHNKKQNIETQHSSIASKNIVSLPWIPGISPKLKKAFKKAGYTPVFKSPKNLQHILTTKNKPPLPINSYPGVYKLEFSCKKCYMGEIKLKISSRIYQHQKNTSEGNRDYSAIAEHLKIVMAILHGTIKIP
ncbi:uncharacterized protein LOC136073864 [Hydra vulgaris]|uniref:uncharacterized protein LOC136073864 n=1 Tax=Hydra vulgaris TaxID=6087 RepID=UPI0032EA3586